MNLEYQVDQIKEKLWKRIEKATETKDIKNIAYYSDLMQEAEELKKRIMNLFNDINTFERKLTTKDDENVDAGLSRKEKGKIRRNNFFKELKEFDINLVCKKGIIYKNENNKLIGIATAEKRNAKWFLGLPQRDDYYSIVLLCEKENGEIIKFILSSTFVEDYRDRFYVYKKDFKFQVFQKNEKYYMRVRQEQVDINKYINNFNALK